jgi:hypothetical protein
MAEQRSDEPRRYDETTAPQNPPNSVLNKDARRAAVWSYFVPIVVLFVVIGVGMLYWSSQGPATQTDDSDRSEIGTAGRTDGGFDPKSPSDNTRDEIRYRADDLAPITSVRQLQDVDARTMTGRRVSIDDAEVDSANGTTVWVRDGDAKFAVIAPEGTGAVKSGSKVSITGRIQPDEQGAPTIRADRIQAR